MKKLLIPALLLIAAPTVKAQQKTENTSGITKVLTQRVRGRVSDAESKQPLAGVIVYLSSINMLNASTDSNGYFSINNVPVGRQSFQFSYIFAIDIQQFGSQVWREFWRRL